MKITPQRQLILDVFIKEEGHPSPEELYQRVRRLDNTIGQSTVYRTLKLLNESGLAREYLFGDGPTRYEPLYGQEHHEHLICERCGATIEVVDEAIEKLQEELAARHGFQLTAHRMYLYGVCPACRAAAAKTD